MRRRDTIYNFNDKNGILKFKELTSKDSLSSIFGSGHILEEARLWLKSVKNMLHQAFPVVRVKNSPKISLIHNQMLKKAELLAQIEKIKQSPNLEERKIQIILELQSQIENINLEICEMVSKKNANKIQEHYSNMTECGFSMLPKCGN